MATIKDIARLAGVSQGTVSNVLNKKGNVSTDKIRLVKQAARSLGYNANLQASRLRGVNTRHVAVILPNIEADLYHSFYSTLSALLAAEGYEISLHLSDNLPDREQACHSSALSYRPKAVVTVSCVPEPCELYRGDVSVLLMDLPAQEGAAENLGFYHFDYGEIAARIEGHVRESGAKSLVLFGDPLNIPFDRELARRLGECGLPMRLWSCDHRQMESMAFELVKELEGGELVLAANNLRAASFRAAQRLTCNRDAQMLSVRSTRAAQSETMRGFELDYRKMARRMVEHILAGGEREDTVLPPDGIRHTFPFLHPGTRRELTLITMVTSTTTALQSLAPAFESRTGAKLKVIALPHQELYGALRTATPEHYDLIRMDMVWRRNFEQRLCADLKPWAERIGAMRRRFPEPVRAAYRQDDPDSRVLPLDPTTQLLFYRSDLFRDASISRLFYERTRQVLEVPADFEQFNRVAAFFTRALNPDSPTEFGTVQTYGSAAVAACDFLPRLYSLGGEVLDEAGRVCVDSPLMRRALESYVETRRYAVPALNYWWGSSLKSFAQGECAMCSVFISYASPIINSRESRVVGKVRAAPVPGDVPLLGGGCIGISKGTDKAELCLDFLDWIYSDEMAVHLNLLGGLSPCRAAFESEEIAVLHPWLREAQEHFRIAKREHITPARPEGFDDYRFEQILGMAVRDAAMGTGDIPDVLRGAQERCEREL